MIEYRRADNDGRASRQCLTPRTFNRNAGAWSFDENKILRRETFRVRISKDVERYVTCDRIGDDGKRPHSREIRVDRLEKQLMELFLRPEHRLLITRLDCRVPRIEHSSKRCDIRACFGHV